MEVHLDTNLKQRLVIGSLLTAGTLLAIYFSIFPIGAFVFTLLLSLIAGRALYEYCNMSKGIGFSPPIPFIILWNFFFYLALYGKMWLSWPIWLPVAVAIGGVFLLFFNYFSGGSKPLANIALSILGFIYISLAFGSIIQIYDFFPPQGAEDGRWWLLFAVLVPKLTDTAAYAIGKNWGHRLLAPHISPKKTIEGAFGGLAAGCTSAAILWAASAALHQPFSLSFLEAIILGGVISTMGQLGDLAESLLKRDAKIKDSGHIPGVGGVFDVIDSLLFAVPTLYLYLLMR